MKKLAIVLLLILLATPAFAGFQLFDVWYVSPSGSDANSGESAGAPFKTITKALSVASSFDFVIVYPGTYSKATGETFPLVVGSNVKLTGSQGARMTIIDGTGATTVLVDLNGVSEDTVIAGFTFQDAYRVGTTPDPLYGGVMTCRNNCRAVIESNYFYSNAIRGGTGTAAHPIGGNVGGAAIYADGTSAATIRNNVFDSNQSWGGHGATSLQAKGGLSRGGAVLAAGPSFIVHNTFHLNYSVGGKGSTSPNASLPGGNGGDSWAGAVYAYNGATVANNVIMQSQAIKGSGGDGTPNGTLGNAKEGGLYCSNCTVTHNNIYSSSPAETISYPNSLNVFPGLLDYTTFHIRFASPMRGAGAPAYKTPRDFDGYLRPAAPAIGAHEPTTRGDLDGDGKADLFWRKADTGENAAWLMDGVTLASSAFVQSIPPELQMVGLGDFNSDRKADILFRNPATGANQIMLMNGAATQSVLNATPLVSQLWNVAAVADFNADGVADILWRHSTTGANALWMMNGGTLLTSHVLDPMPVAWSVAGVGDFNTDHLPDIVWRNSTTGENRLWLMAGNKIAAVDNTLMPGLEGSWKIGGVGEFGGVGSADLLWRHEVSGENMMWKRQMNSPYSIKTLVPLPDTQWSVAAIGNFDGDWYDDILWRHATTGDLAVWIVTIPDPGISNSAYLPVQLPDANWKVAR